MCCISDPKALARLKKKCENGPVKAWKLLVRERESTVLHTPVMWTTVRGPGKLPCHCNGPSYKWWRPHGVHVFRKYHSVNNPSALSAYGTGQSYVMIPVYCRDPIACGDYRTRYAQAVFLDVEIRKKDWNKYVLQKK